MAALWTPHLEKRVVEMWQAKATYTEIGKELRLSRSAVAGKLKRLRAKGLIDGRQTTGARDIVVKLRQRAGKPKMRVRVETIRLPSEVPAAVAAAPGGSKRLTDLKPFECRYPFGEGPYFFCGEPTVIGSSWCPYHHLVCCRKVGEVEV